jgi:hypothetical protein
MADLISRAYVLAEYDRQHQGPPGGARKIMEDAPAVDAIPVEWLEYMQRESLSENDRTMVGAIEAIFIEWHIYVNRLREMNRRKEQEAR